MKSRFLPTSRWAERHVTLDGRPYRDEDFPHLREPLEVLDLEPGYHVQIRLPPQTGKNLLIQINLARDVCVRPQRTLVYSPAIADAKSFSDSKLRLILDETHVVASRRKNAFDKRGGKLSFPFVFRPVELKSANKKSDRQSHSAEKEFRDEVWLYQNGWSKEIKHRTSSYKWRAKVVDTTTGAEVGTDANDDWESSTQGELNCKCPHCDQLFEPHFGTRETEHGLKWDSVRQEGTDLWDAEAAAKTTRYVLPCCKKEVKYSRSIQKMMLSKCEYVHRFPGRGIWGFHSNSIPFYDWAEIVMRYLKACNGLKHGDPSAMKDFVLKDMAGTWNPKAVGGVSNIKISVGHYKSADVWDDDTSGYYDEETKVKSKPFRFMLVDTQAACYWVEIRDYSPLGYSRFVHYERVNVVQRLKDLADEFHVPHDEWVGRGLCNSNVFMDAAWEKRQQHVYEVCCLYGFHAFNCVSAPRLFKHPDGNRRFYSYPIFHPLPEARKTVSEFHIASNIIYDGFAGYTAAVDAKGRPMWTVSSDAPAEYLKQLPSEVKRQNSKGRWEWVKINRDNHAIDMGRVGYAVAGMRGLLEVGVDKTTDEKR